MRKWLLAFLLLTTPALAEQSTFLQKLEQALLKDNALLREGVDVQPNGGAYEILVHGTMQSLFMVFPEEPKAIDKGPGMLLYEAKETGGYGRIYRLFIYGNPELQGLKYVRSAQDLVPKARSKEDARERLAKSREVVAWDVARRFANIKNHHVSIEDMGFTHQFSPYNYSSGLWKLMIKDSQNTTSEVLFRVLVTEEAIYAAMVQGGDLSSERWSRLTNAATPMVFVESAQVFTPRDTHY